jgi:hypothetical protein
VIQYLYRLLPARFVMVTAGPTLEEQAVGEIDYWPEPYTAPDWRA